MKTQYTAEEWWKLIKPWLHRKPMETNEQRRKRGLPQSPTVRDSIALAFPAAYRELVWDAEQNEPIRHAANLGSFITASPNTGIKYRYTVKLVATRSIA